MVDSKSSEDYEVHITFCNRSSGCQYPGCWQRTFEEMNDVEENYYPSDDEYDHQDDGERFCFYCSSRFNQGVCIGMSYYNVCENCTGNTNEEHEETSQGNLYEEPGTVCQDACLNCKANPSKDGVCICREGDSE